MKSQIERILQAGFRGQRKLMVIVGIAGLLLVAKCLRRPEPSTIATPPIEDETFVPTPDSLLPKLIIADTTLAWPQVLEAAFIEGAKLDDNGDTFAFSAFTIGSITLHTSKILASDPINITHTPAFVDEFPTGTFPVQMSRLASDNAFCRILFSNAPVAEWQVALQPGEKPIQLGKAYPYCYGVDSGTGVFIDEQARKAFDALGEKAIENMFAAIEDKPYPTAEIYRFGTESLVLFTTGAGDGCYACYIARDHNGHICQLLVDFDMTIWF